MENSIENQIKGKKTIGSGASRIVYDLGNGSVLKVAKSKNGIKSNMIEVTTYHSSPSPIRKHLAQIIEYENEYRWLIMKKYNQNFPDHKECKQKLYELRATFREYGIIPYDIVKSMGNPNYDNLRVEENGKIIVIDYGDFRFRRNSW